MSKEKAEKRNPNALKEALERTTAQQSIGSPGLPRQRVSFMVDHTKCAPGVFLEDFELTLVALNSAQELESSRRSKDPVEMGLIMVRMSMEAVNGTPVSVADGEDEWLWNAIGASGRQLVAKMFSHIGGADDDLVGKAEKTMRVH